jgi:DNA repair protein RecN (Recombination protein N)
MLLNLSISDFVLVERLSLEFGPGFSVLTGETGAGKSILLDALALVLGERADAGVVRAGAARAEVSAEFSLPADGGLVEWLQDNDLDGDDDVLLLRRVVESGGRSRGFINGRTATAQQMKSAGEFLVDIHGQHAHYSLLKSSEQRRLLDAFAGSAELARDTMQAWRGWRDAVSRREAAQSHAGEQDAERERLGWIERELDLLAFSHDDWQALQEVHSRLAHAADLLSGAQAAREALAADETGVLQRLRTLRGSLGDLVVIDAALQEPLGLLESALESLQEAARELNRYADRVELDPQALEQAEQRIAAVQAAARKFRLRPEEIPEHLAATRAQLLQLGAAADVEALARAEAAAEAEYRTLGSKLTELRRAAVTRLERAVSAAMQQLSMQGGCFEVALTATEPAAHGLEEIEFRVSPHAGQIVKPLAKTASGGELSRIGLALQTVLSGTSGAPTLLFDEVDSGIGGGVAEIVGRMLAELGQTRQVLCVTHLPQVAARAVRHYQVSKSNREGRAVSSVAVLERAERIEEIARMLGGVRLTDATRKHAEEMLSG